MASTQDTCSPIDSMGAFYPLHQRSEAAESLPPVKPIEVHQFYERIHKNRAEFVQPGDRRNAGGQLPRETVTGTRAKEQNNAPAPAFGTLKAFTDVLERILKGFEKNGS
jgi:hypothetical protein